jgi:hypothetical protein
VIVRRPTADEAVDAYLATVAKRWAEGNVYDRLGYSTAFGKLRDLPPAAKYGIEAGLSYLASLADVNLGRSGKIAELVRALVTDAPAELSKRIINGKPPTVQRYSRPRNRE